MTNKLRWLVVLYFVIATYGDVRSSMDETEYVTYRIELPARPAPVVATPIQEPKKVNHNVWMRWGMTVNQYGQWVSCEPEC